MKLRNPYLLFASSILLAVALVACKKSDSTSSTTSLSDDEELGQQAGDVMSSVDESGGSSGTIGLFIEVVSDQPNLGSEINRLEARYAKQIEADSSNNLPPIQSFADCSSADFSSCSSNVITRTFSSCTIGSATFSGSVTLTWATAATSCILTGTGGTISRLPNFTVTGRRGATLTVAKTASATYGQRLTWSSGSGSSKVFSFTNDGINRKFTTAGGATLFDITTATTSAITVTGTARSSRVMNGGTLRVTNNVSGVTCDISPSSVTWNASTCNCPRSGSWSGTCSNGNSYSLTITGCGTADLTVGSSSTSVSFDRCSGS